MRAILLAAGEGSRLAPLTRDRPKALVTVRGSPLIEQARAALASAGVADVVVVTGYQSAAVDALGLPTRKNAAWATTNMVASLFAAEDALAGGFLVVYGDILFRPSIVRALLEDPSPIAVAVNTRWRELWQLRMGDPLADAETMRIDGAGNIVELGKRPRSYADVEGQYAGLIRVREAAVAPVVRFYHRLDRARTYDGKPFEKMFMTSFLQEIIHGLMPVRAVRFDGGWAEVDSLQDLAVVEALPAGFFAD